MEKGTTTHEEERQIVAASHIIGVLFKYAGIETQYPLDANGNFLKNVKSVNLRFIPGYTPGIGSGSTNYRPLAS